METNQKSLVVILLITAFTMLISGIFFVQFVVHFWTSIGDLTANKDAFLGAILIAYLAIFSLVGIALGILIDSYLGSLFSGLAQKVSNRRRF